MLGLSYPPPSLDSVSSFPNSSSMASSSLASGSLSTLANVRGIAPVPHSQVTTVRAHQRNLNLPSHSPEEPVEQKVIQSAFAPTFTSMRSLPSFKAGAISEKRRETLRRAKEKTSALETQPGFGVGKKYSQRIGLFSHPQYMGDDYERPGMLAKDEVKRVREKQTKICPYQFRPGGSGRKLRYENMMAAPATGAGSMDVTLKRTPYEWQPQPFDAARDAMKAWKREQEERVINGPFRGGGRAKLKSDMISYLPEVVKLLFKDLAENWGDSNFQAMTREDDKFNEKVRFQFERRTVDSEGALAQFMEVLAATSEPIRKARLKKEDGCWGVVEVLEDGMEWVVFQLIVADVGDVV